MHQEKDGGLRLRPWDKSPQHPSRWLPAMLLAWSGAAALVVTLVSITGVEGVTAEMLVTTSYLCILYGLLLRGNRGQWFFPGVLVLALILVVGAGEQVLEGFRLYWNRMGLAVIRSTGWVLPEWETHLPGEQSRLCLALFSGLLAGTAAWLSCLMTELAPQMLAVVLPGMVLAGMTALGWEPTTARMVIALVPGTLGLMYGAWEGKKQMSPVLLSWGVWGATGAAVVLLALLGPMTQWAESLGEQTRKAAHVRHYETEHTTLSEGDFRDYQTAEQTAEAALVVTMEQPESMYLRGFTGDVLEGNVWKEMDRQALSQNRQLLYWLNLNCFTPNTQFAAAAETGSWTENTITVQNLGACSRYRYVPFSLCTDEKIQPEDLRTGGLDAGGSRVDSFTVVAAGEDQIDAILTWLQTTDDQAVLNYRKAESGYREFVYRYYLQIPEEATALLGQQWQTLADQADGLEAMTAQTRQECVLSFLSRCFPEGGTPEDLALPLDIARGTSYQYATVAALTLRYFGIPARYAEGYRITEALAASAGAGEPIYVDSSCATGWVEVYQDGLGWIPMSLTPGLGETMEETPEPGENTGEDDTEDPEQEPEEAPEDTPLEQQTEVPDAQGGSVVRVEQTLRKLLLPVLLTVLAVLLVLWLRRRYILRKKEARFRAGKPRAAVGPIFADTVALLEALGFDRGNGSVRNLLEPVSLRFGDDYREALNTSICLNDRALFCSRPMEEQQRQTALAFREKTGQIAQRETKWYQRLWLKWIRCLY